jgi:hypothetical protein
LEETIREMDKLAKDGIRFSRWTEDPDTARQQGIGKEEEVSAGRHVQKF